MSAFTGFICDVCKATARWGNDRDDMPPKWSKLSWYESAKSSAYGIEETAAFCSDACLTVFVAKLSDNKAAVSTADKGV